MVSRFANGRNPRLLPEWAGNSLAPFSGAFPFRKIGLTGHLERRGASRSLGEQIAKSKSVIAELPSRRDGNRVLSSGNRQILLQVPMELRSMRHANFSQKQAQGHREEVVIGTVMAHVVVRVGDNVT